MITSILINGVEYVNKVKVGIQYIERIDMELDSGTLIIPFSLLNSPFTPFTRIEVTIDSKIIGMFVLKDQVEIVSLSPAIYKHTIAMIEPTKLLEKIATPNMTFRQPLTTEYSRYTVKSYIERLRHNVPLEVESKWSSTRLFDLSSDFDDLANYDMPETFLNKSNMREAIDYGLKVRDAIVRANLSGTNPSKKLALTIDYFNRLNNSVDKVTGSTNIGYTQDGEYYFGEAESYIENSVNKYLSVSSPNGVLMSLRSDQVNITTENMQIMTRMPIDKLDLVYMEIKLTAPISGDIRYELLDLTSFIYDKTAWDALPEPNSLEARNKGNCVWYSRGDNKIQGWGENVSKWFGLATENIVVRLLKKACDEQGVSYVGYDISEQPYNLKAQVNYYAQVNCILRIEKPDYNDVKTQMNTNQANNQVDMELMANSMRNTMKKLGNIEIQMQKRIKEWNDKVNLGDFTSDGYIVTAIENSIYNDFIMQNIELSKDYNKMSMFVGVNQEARQIPIPKGGVDTFLHYTEYGIIDSVASTSNDSSIKVTMIQKLAEALKQNGGAYILNNAIFFKSDTADWVYSEAEFSQANNTLKLSFGFNSNISAGLKMLLPGTTENSTTRGILDTVKYGDQYGRFTLFKFIFTMFNAYDVTPPNISQYANKLPSAEYGVDFSEAHALIETQNFEYTKDSSEIFKMTYQVPMISKLPNIIVGTEFWNILFGGSGASNQLYLSTTETYDKNFNQKCKGTLLGTVNDYYTFEADENKITVIQAQWHEVFETLYSESIDVYPDEGVYNACPTAEMMVNALPNIRDRAVNYRVRVRAYQIDEFETPTLCDTKYYQKQVPPTNTSVGFGDSEGNLILGINYNDNNTFYINFKNKKE